MIRDFWYGVLDVFLPVTCLNCQNIVETKMYPVPLCGACQDQFDPIEEPYCHRCARPIGSSDDQSLESFAPSVLCGDCRTRQLTLDATYAGYEYRGLMRQVISDWKFAGHEEWGDWFGKRLADTIEFRTPLDQIDFIQPIPLHENRHEERGFNQARQLASGLSEVWGIPVISDLEKIRETAPQVELSREERMENLRGVFSVDSNERLADSHVVLVDDIFTTGSTLRTAAGVLMDNGVETVTAVVLARAV